MGRLKNKIHMLLGATLVTVGLMLALGGLLTGCVLSTNQGSFDERNAEKTVTAIPTSSSQSESDEIVWVALLGTEAREDGLSYANVIILARMNSTDKTMALVSIPRDTRVFIKDQGYHKISTAYAFDESKWQKPPGLLRRPEYTLSAISQLTGVNISNYMQTDLDGFRAATDALGGVTVDVAVGIPAKSGSVEVPAGHQALDGVHALAFCRSSENAADDYQQQANQRTFLRAAARQILAADPVTIVNTVTQLSEMTTTDMSIAEIARTANAMRGLEERSVYSYCIPSQLSDIDGVRYVVVNGSEASELFAALNTNKYPNAPAKAVDVRTDAPAKVVDVRNGWGNREAALSVMGTLVNAGYKQGRISDAASFVYNETLIVYQDDADRAAALDIQAHLGYGRILPSMGRYTSEANILVIVGADCLQ